MSAGDAEPIPYPAELDPGRPGQRATAAIRTALRGDASSRARAFPSRLRRATYDRRPPSTPSAMGYRFASRALRPVACVPDPQWARFEPIALGAVAGISCFFLHEAFSANSRLHHDRVG